MKPTFDNEVLSSLLLWMDHQILDKGSAFTNTSSNFYSVPNKFNGLYTYGLPFGAILDDFSISGASIPTGVFLSGSFVIPGQSGFSGINYRKGQAYFSNPVANNAISGSFALKDFNIALTSEPEERLLFSTNYILRPKTAQTATGLQDNETPYPVIFIRKNGSENTPFAFGGMDNTQITASVIIVTDSQFSLDGVTSILRDSVRTRIPLIHTGEMPYDALGRFKSGNYNYISLTSGKLATDDYVFLCKAKEVNFDYIIRAESKTLSPKVYLGLVDLIVEKPRFPRL